MKDPMVQAAAAASLLTLACTSGDALQVDTTTTGPPPATSESGSESGTSGPEPEPAPPDGGAPCRVDADCSAGAFCELRVCVAGCEDAAGCDAGQACDPHGRCHTEGGGAVPRPVADPPTLGERTTVLAAGETEARTALENTGAATLTYRIAANHPAVILDPVPKSLPPGGEVDLVVDVDLTALGPDDHVLPVQVITSGGGLLWSIEIPAAPEAGHFGGSVSFAAGDVSLGSSELVLDLDFRADGTVVGRVDNDASLLWPQPVALKASLVQAHRRSGSP